MGIDMSAVTVNGKPDVTINPKVDLGASQTWDVSGPTSTNIRTLTVNGVISGASGNVLTKSGLGNLTLTGTNTYSGGTVLNAGKLNINTAYALGTGGLMINGGTIDNSSATVVNMSNKNALVINSDFSFTGTQDLKLTGDATLGTSNGTSRTITAVGANANSMLTLEGNIVDGTTANQLIKDGVGSLTLTGTNTFSGGLVVKRGAVILGKTGATSGGSTFATGTGAITLGDAAGGDVSLVVGSYTLTNNINLATGAAGTKMIGVSGVTRSPTFSGAIALNGNNLILDTKKATSGGMTLSGGITGIGNLLLTNGAAGEIKMITAGINNTGSITVSGSTNSGTNVISAVIGANVTTLTLDNAAKLILSNSNAYAGGTTVSSGLLIGAAAGAFGMGGMTVADGAALLLENASTLNDFSALVLGATSRLSLDFAGTDIVGSISLNGGVTTLAAGVYDAATLSALNASGTYTGAGSLTVIPEPATFLLFSIGGMGVWLIRCKRRKVSDEETDA